MRYLALEYIREPMILGKTIYGENGEILLRENAVILQTYIAKIEKLGYFGLYIKDEISEDISVKDVINEDLKMRTIQAVKTMMNINREDDKGFVKSFENIEGLIQNIVQDISSNKGVIINMIDLKVYNNYTFYHSVNVTMLALVVGLALNLNTKDMNNLGVASLLHDIGKVFTPNEILDKPGGLTTEEYDIIKEHPENGYRHVKNKLITHTSTNRGILVIRHAVFQQIGRELLQQ